jgi:hypothetical protein
MQLLHELERLAAAEESLFRRQLFSEDIARLRKLDALRGASDLNSFKKAGMRLGWTQGDARTAEIRPQVEALLEAVFARDEGRIASAWHELHRARMERLLGCLSTPAPKPVA